MIDEVVTNAGLGKSDHFSLIIKLTCNYDDPTKQSRYNFKKTNIYILREVLGTTNWKQELENLYVKNTWIKIRECIHTANEKSTPKSRIPLKRGKSWMDKTTLKSIRQKHRLFRIWKDTRDAEDYRQYSKASNKARKSCRAAQRKLEEEMAAKAKENTKAFWRYVNSKTKSRSGVADMKKDDNTLTVNDMEKAELLNSFFQRMYTIEDEEPLPDMPIYKVKEDLVYMEINQK